MVSVPSDISASTSFAAPSPRAKADPQPQNDSFAAIEEAEWQDQREARMAQALTTLDPRSRDILQRRWLTDGEKAGLQQLADEYGVSAERIRQIEAAAMKKLRKVIEPAEA